ncbi:hypothetical protein RZN22_11665 [Bacillaceae bacterium S4-13-58]
MDEINKNNNFTNEDVKNKLENGKNIDYKALEEIEQNETMHDDDDRHNRNARASAALEPNVPRINPENL